MLDFEKDPNLETPYAYQNKEASHPGITVDSKFNPFQDSSSKTTFRGGGEPKSAKGWENMYVGLESKFGQDDSFSSVHFESDTITGTMFPGATKKEDNGATTFQLRRKYIVTTIKSGMLIIDQNRAHQRVLYENFLKCITGKETLSQQLLFPLNISFSKGHIEIIRHIQDNLSTLGFVFASIDEDKVEIIGVPPLVPQGEVGIVLDQLIADWNMEVSEHDFSQSDMLAKTMSKTLAVKTGVILDPVSQIALVNDLFACKESMLSPFNKSIYITLSENDIDNKFN